MKTTRLVRHTMLRRKIPLRFRSATRDELRAWRETAIKHTREQVLELLGAGSEAAARLLSRLEAA